MHVFLKNGKLSKLLIVDLVDGCTPTLVGYTGSRSRVTAKLEPAIWFKVMVIEMISIDCEKNLICWTVNSSDPSSTVKEHKMFDEENQNLYDFDDDLDELYQLASFLVKTNPMSVLNNKERHDLIEEYETSLFRLLHCYILEKIKLNPEDIAQVERVYDSQLQAILVLDDAIVMHKRLSESYFSELKQLQESRILPFFSHIAANGGCSLKMISLLLENINKDLDKISNDLDIAQRRVDQAKLTMNEGATSKDFANTLATARGKRDILMTKKHQLLEWREMLAIQKKNLKVTDVNGPLDPVFLQYMEIYERFQAERQASKEFCDKKIRAVSVRVCIENALADLREGNDSQESDMASDGHRPTDVLIDGDSHSEWKTLSGKLASILHNSENPNGKRFIDFILNIKQQCNQVFRAYESLLETSSVADVEGFTVISHRNIDFAQQLDEIKCRVSEHLEESTVLLLEYFQKRSEMFWRKLRLAYERYFFSEIGDYLIRLYRIVNGNIMLDLEKRVIRLKDFPVCRLGLQMKDEWWLSLFEPATVPSDVSCEALTSCSTAYLLACERCSLEQSCCGHQQEKNQSEFQEDSASCYKNVDLMREKLQIGAAKVLSRSWSDLPMISDVNIIRYGANIMSNEINAKVKNNLQLIPHKKVFGSFRKEARSYTNYNDQLINKDDKHRNRSVSTPHLLKFDSQLSNERGSNSPASIRGADKFKMEELPLNRKNSFNRHFGTVIECIRAVFKAQSPLSKGQCLTESLSNMVQNVAKLRSQDRSESCDNANEASYAVSAEDLLPLLVLMLLKLDPDEVAKLYVEMCFISDMLVDFLSSGCHSYALTVFQTSFRILGQVFEELDFP